MKAGKEYEIFVYDKFKSFFSNFELVMNDRILGKESAIKREIDISIKGKIENIDLLYIVQCKDHKKRADIKIIGEFSSVIKDLGASKGFLICSSGFAKTIHNYAKTKGIELLTLEDINSDKWNVKIEIPIVYTINKLNGSVDFLITTTQELIDKNPNGILITDNDFMYVTLDNGKNIESLEKFINEKIKLKNLNIHSEKEITISQSNLQIELSNCWIPCEINIQLDLEKTFYLKYLTPNEYSHIVDHITNKSIPLKLSINDFNLELDSTYTKISNEDLSTFNHIKIELENILENSITILKPEVGSKITITKAE